MKKKVIIIGAGLSGLAAAYKLSEDGFSVSILEKNSFIGGQAGRIIKGSFIYDLGPHRFHTENREIELFIRKLLGNSLLDLKMKTYLYFEDKYFNYPLSFKNLLLKSDKQKSVVAAIDFLFHHFRNRFNKNISEASFADWVTARYGKVLYNYFFKDYTQKVWGLDPKFLSSSWAESRIATKSLSDALISLLKSKKTLAKECKAIHSPFKEDFIYTKRGIGEIAFKMEEFIILNKGKILLNNNITSFEIKDNRIKSAITNEGKKFQADCFLSTMPLNELLPALKIKNSETSLNYRDLVLLFINLKKEPLLGANWVYYQDNKYLFNRITDFGYFTSSMAPPGNTSLCFEITCDAMNPQSVWNQPDEQIYQKIINEAIKLNLFNKSECISYHIYRLDHAYPVFEIGFEKKLIKCMEILEKIGNFYTFGRNGSFKYINMDHCIMDGFRVAERILSSQ